MPNPRKSREQRALEGGSPTRGLVSHRPLPPVEPEPVEVEPFEPDPEIDSPELICELARIDREIAGHLHVLAAEGWTTRGAAGQLVQHPRARALPYSRKERARVLARIRAARKPPEPPTPAMLAHERQRSMHEPHGPPLRLDAKATDPETGELRGLQARVTTIAVRALRARERGRC